ncbi:p53-induced death domain-containing protein 1 [Conger conger]|uniref:p53-induced death domain-containing protein 1 n=1 Tax=Conger conger TaxID=82655 RepID=UPI002A5A15A6|nr:p53-induced death domain-containing protein 1 [Conger conger]
MKRMEKARERSATDEAGLGEESVRRKDLDNLPGELERRRPSDRETRSQRSGEEQMDLRRAREEQINTGTKRREIKGEEKELSGWEEGRAKEAVEKDGAEEATIPSLSPSPSLCLTEAWPSSTSSSSSSSSQLPSSAPCPLPRLSPALPDALVVLADARLTLDVYRDGAAALPALWAAAPGRLGRVRYLRLGSEDLQGLQEALTILPLLTQLHSLAIRGHCLQDGLGDPLPGLLSSLPPSLRSLSSLTHLDLSFNRLTSLPPCLLSLPLLSSLLLSHNLLSSLPSSVGELRSLSFLSLLGNRLQTVPPSLGHLGALCTLDLSHNQLQRLPPELGLLESLQSLELSHNCLRELPHTLGSLLSLRELSIHSNDIRSVPPCLKDLPHLIRLDVRNNPLGRPPTPPPLPLPTSGQMETELPELHLGPNQHCFFVSESGCNVFLPGGAELQFPRGAVASKMMLTWTVKRPDRKWVWLEEHDFLLSWPLELLPHGTAFLEPVLVCVPYRRFRRGEVVVRRFDGQCWSTLPTMTRRGSQRHSARPGGRPARLACCSVKQFSWFVAVSRLVRDSCSVSPEGALLVSRVDSGIKLTFPSGSTLQNRTVMLQVLQVDVSEVQKLTGDPQASVSPLLCVSQSPSMPFLRPVTVQVPLPPGLTGHTVDMSCLYLLHGDQAAQTWTDVTPQSSLQITHLYAIFTVTHFSWYWLWYTTKRSVCGVVRKVYHRLRQFRVQFLVLQRKADPMQVLLQCLPTSKVDSCLQSLSPLYEGPQPSDLCELMEGEQFFAGFESGININSDRPDCTEGRLCFVFYSNLKNHKEVYICPSQHTQEAVRGQVSFYRGEMPRDIPPEVAQKRKGHDSQWLATLPLRLPGALSNKGEGEELQYRPLNLGDPESGYLTEANLLAISLQIGEDWRSIGINLGITYQELDRIQYRHRDNLGGMVLEMLFHWARRRGGAGPGAVPELQQAMVESRRQDLADEIEDIVSLGRRKYRESLRRVGLDTPTVSAE